MTSKGGLVRMKVIAGWILWIVNDSGREKET